MTSDPEALDRFWLGRYAPEVISTEARRYPTIDQLRRALDGDVQVSTIPIPIDCTDGPGEAYYGRPERLLDAGARRANSAWSFLDPATMARSVDALGDALVSGDWDREFGHLRDEPYFNGSLVLVVGRGR